MYQPVGSSPCWFKPGPNQASVNRAKNIALRSGAGASSKTNRPDSKNPSSRPASCASTPPISTSRAHRQRVPRRAKTSAPPTASVRPTASAAHAVCPASPSTDRAPPSDDVQPPLLLNLV
ncbi:uncharacterized protein A4U43_C07F34820 [Asparagus officinalis]|uniref:Uncharacterized protein n=1 Tax=Asparagus officinalis TaxID=4686 RepID=A0A5P1EKU8_ASPOF|nr:uncharacterized protein A4U43_C07F34820 [Asparagus officinalis]